MAPGTGILCRWQTALRCGSLLFQGSLGDSLFRYNGHSPGNGTFSPLQRVTLRSQNVAERKQYVVFSRRSGKQNCAEVHVVLIMAGTFFSFSLSLFTLKEKNKYFKCFGIIHSTVLIDTNNNNNTHHVVSASPGPGPEPCYSHNSNEKQEEIAPFYK